MSTEDKVDTLLEQARLACKKIEEQVSIDAELRSEVEVLTKVIEEAQGLRAPPRVG